MIENIAFAFIALVVVFIVVLGLFSLFYPPVETNDTEGGQ